MHASVTITDQVYGRLVGDDVRQIISSLGKQTPLPFRVGGRSDQIDQLIAILEEMRSQ
jgi:hypothetical protein